MPRIAYVNGRYLRHAAAAVHIEDRGYQFADGVYEVCAVLGGKVLDFAAHMARLQRSLGELAISQPCAPSALHVIFDQLVARNRIRDGIVYLQITRGVAARDHAIAGAIAPAIVATTRRLDFAAKAAQASRGVTAVSVGDQRWGRCDIKSVSLLGNVLAKTAARQADAYEAWQVDADGIVTEGASSNCWIVDEAGVLRTHPLGPAILNGITRQVVLRLATAAGIAVAERPFTITEALAAKEAFVTSTTSFVMPVISLDGTKIGNGRPGPVTQQLCTAYWRHVAAETGVDYGSGGGSGAG